MDPAKVAGVKTWPIPTTVKQIQSFLGFCNFYRPFIRQFSHIAKPLNELTRKDVPWDWCHRRVYLFLFSALESLSLDMIRWLVT
jgi:hypothetical protein